MYFLQYKPKAAPFCFGHFLMSLCGYSTSSAGRTARNEHARSQVKIWNLRRSYCNFPPILYFWKAFGGGRWLLRCSGAAKQWAWWPACFARTVCLWLGPFRTINRAGARVRSFDLAKEARQMAKSARCSSAKTIANCSNYFCHLHLISSVSRL
jgi:hypothetical protein